MLDKVQILTTDLMLVTDFYMDVENFYAKEAPEKNDFAAKIF